MSKVVGIDLGTTNSLVADVRDGVPVVIRDKSGDALVPSVVTAAPDEVPAMLVQQLKVGGLMAVPVGTVMQELRILRRTETGTETLDTLPVRFVPMTNKPKDAPD